MRILVCGGAGYIGAHMCKLLAEAGHEVAIVDNLSTGHLEAVQWGPLFEGSIGDAAFMDEVFERFEPQAVFHFAALSIVGDSVREPASYFHNNVAATLCLLDRIRALPGCSFVFSSTAAVYGVPLTARIAEDHPTRPINPYGRSKLMIEQLLVDYWSAYQLPSMSFRYFNAAGADPSGAIGEAHSPETHLIPLTLEACLGRVPPLRVFGTDYDTPDGTCIRDYIHVNDLCSAHLAGLDHLLAEPGNYHFNLGNGEGFSVREVIATAREVTGRDIPHSYSDRRPGDPPRLVADAHRAATALEWAPKTPALTDIIESAWRWHSARKF